MNDNKPFPIQRDTYRDSNGEIRRPVEDYGRCTIPWWLAQEAYLWYSKLYGNSQSLECLAERGGFGREELLRLLRKESY